MCLAGTLPPARPGNGSLSTSGSLTVGLEGALPALLADAHLAEIVLEVAQRWAADPSVLGLANPLLYVGRRS